ncbi:MAG: helix-turn-helix transcriptional regulator [Gammaproteobacteria bacterium]|nr:helix-turn-helix transcriptional regulator [Gammaproteobacteria bacterium]MDE2274478.1 helix-turn-helix transcriptional regulator [Gammaproteobacteria bacterium]
MVALGSNRGTREANSGGTSPSSRIFTRYQAGPVLYFPDEPALAGGQRGSYVFERRTVPPNQLPPHVFDSHMFLLVLGETAVPYRSRLNGRQIIGRFEPGRLRFVAAGDSLSTSWNQPIDSILVAVQPDVLHRALGDDMLGPSLELISKAVLHDDPTLAHLTLALQSHLETGGLGGRLFEQSLLTAIAAHLLCVYGSHKRAANNLARSNLLPRWKLLRIEEYVRNNLARQDLHLGEIAAAVKLSPCQLSRAFKTSTGKGLWQFVLECRVQAAMAILRQKPAMPLALVASDCGFESYSQFIAAFRKFCGLLPSEFCKTLGHH